MINLLLWFWFLLLASTQTFLAGCWCACLISDLLFRLQFQTYPKKNKGAWTYDEDDLLGIYEYLNLYLDMIFPCEHWMPMRINLLLSFWLLLLASTQSFLAGCWSASLISDLLFRFHIPGIPKKLRAHGPMTKTICWAFTNTLNFTLTWSLLANIWGRRE